MPLTDRMLQGAIAANPGQPDKAGEYRYCVACGLAFFTRPAKPDKTHADHATIALPALNPDGSERLAKAFRAFLKRWSPERQEQLDRFASRKGWELAYEHQSGGGALNDSEVAEWRVIVEAEMKRLVMRARAEIAAAELARTTTG